MPGAGTASDALRVADAGEVAFAIADASVAAEAMGLDESALAASVRQALGRAGLSARPSLPGLDQAVLLVDVLVEDGTYYASAGFWRVASLDRPGGGTDTDFVTVWQDFSIGAHHGNTETIRAAVSAVIDRFIQQYRQANDLADIDKATAAR